MYWYVAKIIYQIMIANGEYSPQFEEQLRLIQANNGQEALEKATALGEQEETVFYNYQDEPVYWKFLEVPELQPIEQLNDGLQLHSHIEEPEYADNYLALMQSKADNIRFDKESLY